MSDTSTGRNSLLKYVFEKDETADALNFRGPSYKYIDWIYRQAKSTDSSLTNTPPLSPISAK